MNQLEDLKIISKFTGYKGKESYYSATRRRHEALEYIYFDGCYAMACDGYRAIRTLFETKSENTGLRVTGLHVPVNKDQPYSLGKIFSTSIYPINVVESAFETKGRAYKDITLTLPKKSEIKSKRLVEGPTQPIAVFNSGLFDVPQSDAAFCFCIDLFLLRDFAGETLTFRYSDQKNPVLIKHGSIEIAIMQVKYDRTAKILDSYQSQFKSESVAGAKIKAKVGSEIYCQVPWLNEGAITKRKITHAQSKRIAMTVPNKNKSSWLDLPKKAEMRWYGFELECGRYIWPERIEEFKQVVEKTKIISTCK